MRSESKRIQPHRDSALWINIALQMLLCIGAVLLYTSTLNRDVQPADSGEFQIAAYTLGIPHPPGYPLFTMLGWLFAQIPIGSPYARISFLSVIASSATLLLVSLTVQILTADVGAGDPQGIQGNDKGSLKLAAGLGIPFGLVAAVALGTSTTFWAQATTTNIRSLTAFFTALMIFALALVYTRGAHRGASRPTVRALCLFACALGLGVGHHVSLVFVGAIMSALVVIIIIRRKLPLRTLAPAGLCLIATQVVWLYLPLRDAAGARFAPGNLTTLDGLLFHIFARGFAGDMLAFAAPEYLFDRLAILPALFQFEFSPPILALMALGTFALLARRRSFDITLVAAFIVHTFITITYRAPQTVEYAMPSWVILCVLLGRGGVALYAVICRLVIALPKGFRAIPGTLLLLCGVFLIRDAWERYPSFVALSADTSTRASASGALAAVPPGAVIMAQWHQATPMWALQDIEAVRRDVQVEYVYPRGAQPYADTFADQAVAALAHGPTYATSFYAAEYTARGLGAFPMLQPGLWELRLPRDIQPGATGTPGMQGMRLFDNRIEAAGLTLLSQDVSVGQALDINVAWRAREPAKANEALTVRIMRSDGRLAANADIQLDPQGEVDVWQSRQVRLGIPLDLTPGMYEVLVGAYRTELGKFVTLAATDIAFPKGFIALNPFGKATNLVAVVHISPAAQPPLTQHPLAQPFPAGAVLVGVDYDTGIPGKWRMMTHWQLPSRPLTISIQSADGELLSPPQGLPATEGKPGYFTLIHDIAPAVGLRVVSSALPKGFKAMNPLGSDPQQTFAIPDGTATERYIAFVDQMVLTAVSTHREGSQLKVDMIWIAAKPLTTDYIVSARVSGDGYSGAHDGAPALGALPTLKWIRGSRVMDRHPLVLGGYAGLLHGTVVVYDSATQQLLPALDERYENGITFDIDP